MWPVVLVLTGWKQIYGSTIWVKYLKNNSLFLHFIWTTHSWSVPFARSHYSPLKAHHFFLLLVHSRTLLADCFSRSIQKMPNFHSSLPISRQKSHMKKKIELCETLWDIPDQSAKKLIFQPSRSRSLRWACISWRGSWWHHSICLRTLIIKGLLRFNAWGTYHPVEL